MNKELGIEIVQICLCVLLYSLFLIPNSALAQGTDYNLLAPIPLDGGGSGNTSTTNASQYIKGVFILTIAIAGVLAVVMIIFGGIKYMSTDAFTGKDEAKGTIQNALWGLLLAIGAWLILYTVNPNLVNLTLTTLTPQPIPTIVSGVHGAAPSTGCPNCVIVGVPHKGPPTGCHPIAPETNCTIDRALNDKLLRLSVLHTFTVTESYPPTIQHQNACHAAATCVDATITSNTPQNIAAFISKAQSVGLRAQFEVTSQARATQIINAAGLSPQQVIVVPGINNEHFSIYMN